MNTTFPNGEMRRKYFLPSLLLISEPGFHSIASKGVEWYTTIPHALKGKELLISRIYGFIIYFIQGNHLNVLNN